MFDPSIFDPDIFDAPGLPSSPSASGLPHRYAVDGQDLGLWAYAIGKPIGVDEMPPLRGSNAPFTGLPGSQYLAKLRDSRHFALPLWVLGTDPDGNVSTDNRRHARQNIDALFALLGARGQRMVTRLMPDGTLRICQAEVSRVTHTAGRIGDGSLFQLVVEFGMADPHWYGPAVIGTPLVLNATERSMVLQHPGTAETHRLVFDLTGPFTTVRVTNDTTGAWFEYVGAVASGRHLVVDSGAFSASNDGADVAGQLSHGGAISFSLAVPGANTLIVSTVVAGGSFVASLTPAFY